MADAEVSAGGVFDGHLSLEAKLERARTELLDLSARNRLLNTPRSSRNARTLEIVDEQSAEIFRLLVRQQRQFTFLPGRAANGADAGEDDGDEVAELAQPEDDGLDERGVANRHADTRLQTRLTPPGLQKRLLDLHADARTLEEEQGVNILFLALGFLKWIDPSNAANIRHAPLVLVPVALERGNAAEKFKLKWRGDDVAANLSLEAYLDRAHGIRLPSFEPGEDFDPAAYAREVAEAVASKQGWEVLPDQVTLGFFSFAKFLMYRDLDPAVWPDGHKLGEHDLVRSLVSDGFDGQEALLAEDASIDENIAPAQLLHIVDSDSSQTLAVHEARAGRNLVIQGPPGTGKSQTIANVIASAIADGKTVLFVAEKMAALEVVKRRLDNTGVGDACLELHSNKANKRVLLDELRRTWELGTPKGEPTAALNARLQEARDRLNDHARRMHEPLGAAGRTPYQVIGQLTRLRQAGQTPNDIALDGADEWSLEEYRVRDAVVYELSERVGDIGRPADHPWRGVGLESALPADVDRLIARIAELAADVEAADAEARALAAELEAPAPPALHAFGDLAGRASRIAGAPSLDPEALGSEVWIDQARAIDALVAAGQRHRELAQGLSGQIGPQAWDVDPRPLRDALAALPGDLPLSAFPLMGSAAILAERLASDARALASRMGLDAPRTLRDVARLAVIGERVAAAPPADAAALVSPAWDGGAQRAVDLAGAAETGEQARDAVGSRVSDAAWDMDLREARTTLATHGTGFMRLFSGAWRKADRLVRSVLSEPKAPLEERLALLDALARGRAARDELRNEDAFGREVFGHLWRGDRSSAAPLRAVADWVGSLGGLGPEPRLVAARIGDAGAVGDQAAGVARLHAELKQALESLWAEMGGKTGATFGDAAAVDGTALDGLAPRLSAFAQADRRCREILIGEGAELAGRLDRLSRLERAQAAVTELEKLDELGRAAFGRWWRGLDTEWDAGAAAAAWIAANPDIRSIAARIGDREEVAARATALQARAAELAEITGRLGADLEIMPADAFGVAEPVQASAAAIAAKLRAWEAAEEHLSKWVVYREQAATATRLDLGPLVDRLYDGQIVPERAVSEFEMSYYEAVFREQARLRPELTRFDGALHDRAVREFVDLDRRRIAVSSLEVVRAHHARIPARAGGGVGPVGVLRGEIAKKSRHMPIRRLMEQAAPAVQALKPVLMMSPLSVAQFLPPGALQFDLLVMDEASQIQPVDALGAIARCRQVVVVGDPRQLPPTAFFAKMTGSGDADDEGDTARVADVESILGLFTARGLPTRMLRWHYRSRHQSLIAVSNKQFYEDKLFIVPSPYTAEGGLGLRFHHVPHGLFDAGATRTNATEAKMVAEAIVAHAQDDPDLTLGVVAFSAAQRRAIVDQLELLRRGLPPHVEAFFQAHPAEPFFVKNLENVQGDERDVIMISVGYGPTAPGLKPPMRFGPLGQDGGERRLNVLISRAKRRCEVFASMTDEDIDPDFASTRKGVFAFKLFMHFARTGRMQMAEISGRDHDSVFEEQVAQALHARGYQVHRQVGLAGFFIDLAISDPERADRYLLGIECDGASYHGARSARDRDRLRQAVLEDHGWIIHRIWSTDWFRRPKEQLERVVAAVEAAKAELASRASRPRPRGPLEIVTVERETVTEIGLSSAEAPAPATRLYEEAVLTRPDHVTVELHEASRGILSQLVEQVVEVESPVHLDEVAARVREAWGLRRAGARIREAVERAADVSIRNGRVRQDGAFLTWPGRAPPVRDRGQARSPTLRDCDRLPPAELEAAAVATVRASLGATREQLVQAVARSLGFKATSSQLRAVVNAAIDGALASEVLAARSDVLELGPQAPPAAGAAKPALSALEALILAGESATTEFKQTFRWDIALKQPNKKLEAAVVRTVAGLANGGGGTLLIGVGDDGTAYGMERDYACAGGSRDKFELQLSHVLAAHFGQAFRAAKLKISFPTHEGQEICRVDVERASSPCFVKLEGKGGFTGERFFVRSGNLTQELPPSETPAYIRERFG